MRKLDIIVPHYKEPFSTGQKFFEMLALQRGIHFDDIRVILVNDGIENALTGELFKGFPFRVDVVTIKHGGVSAARNAGIAETDAKWVCFCDFDDLFASVYSLRNVLELLDTDQFDLLWADFISEDRMKDGQMKYHKRGENVVFIHGKFWRRDWLMKSGLRFNTKLTFNEDSAFCAVASNMMDYKRVGHIESNVPIYIWTFTEGSATTTPGNRIKCLIGLYERNKVVCESMKTVDYKRYCAMISRTVHDSYWSMNLQTIPPELEPYIDDFRQFWKEHKKFYFDTDPDSMREVAEASRREHEAGDIEEEERWLHVNELKTNTNISLSEWLYKLENKGVD